MNFCKVFNINQTKRIYKHKKVNTRKMKLIRIRELLEDVLGLLVAPVSLENCITTTDDMAGLLKIFH